MNSSLAQSLWNRWLSPPQRGMLIRQAGYITLTRRHELLSRAGRKGLITVWDELSSQMRTRLMIAMDESGWLKEEIERNANAYLNLAESVTRDGTGCVKIWKRGR